MLVWTIVQPWPLQDIVGIRLGRPVCKGPPERDYSAWIAWPKGKVQTSRACWAFLLFPFPPGSQGRPSPVALRLQGAPAWCPQDSVWCNSGTSLSLLEALKFYFRWIYLRLTSHWRRLSSIQGQLEPMTSKTNVFKLELGDWSIENFRSQHNCTESF